MAKGSNKLKLIDAPVYRYWEAFYMSFYSKNLYIDVGKRWSGLGIVYLLLAIAVLVIPFSLRMSASFNETFNQQLMLPLSRLPTVYVQNGLVLFDKPMPYLIKNDKDQVVLIVDTTGQVSEFNSEFPNLNILISKDRISYKVPTPQLFGVTEQASNPGIPMVQLFDKSANMVFDGKKIVADNVITGLKFASQLMIYPIVVAILFSMLVVILVVLGFLGQVFARIFFSFQLGFKQSCRLMMVSATPMLLVLMGLLTFNAVFPGVGAILMLLLAICFSFAVYALRTDSRRLVSA